MYIHIYIGDGSLKPVAGLTYALADAPDSHVEVCVCVWWVAGGKRARTLHAHACGLSVVSLT